MLASEVFVAIAFYATAIAMIVGAIGMVLNRDMIRSAMLLVLTLGGVAAMYVLLSADFLAIAQLLVYVGAIMILMLFAIMLTPGQVDLPTGSPQAQRISAALVALAVGGTLCLGGPDDPLEPSLDPARHADGRADRQPATHDVRPAVLDRLGLADRRTDRRDRHRSGGLAPWRSLRRPPALPGAVGDPVRDRDVRRALAQQRDWRAALHRADAERRERHAGGVRLLHQFGPAARRPDCSRSSS